MEPTTMESTRYAEMPRKFLTKVISRCELNLLTVGGVVIGLLSLIWGEKTGLKFIIDGLDIVWHAEMEGYPPEMKNTVINIVTLSLMIKGLTYHLYLISYVLLFYCLWTAKRAWVKPWLMLSFLRSIVMELLECFTGCAICSLYGELKPACLFFITGKAIYLAFTLFLWFQIFEFYLNDPENPRNEVDRRASQRSTDSVLADALYDWFIEEAKTCERFDSDTAVDEDVRKFEERLAYRARQVLNMSPKELIAYEKGIRESLQETPQTTQNSTQTDEQRLESDSCHDYKEYSPLSTSEENFKFDPLKRFPYLKVSSSFDEMIIAEDVSLVDDVVMGTRNAEVQTSIQIPSQLSMLSVDESLSFSIDDEAL